MQSRQPCSHNGLAGMRRSSSMENKLSERIRHYRLKSGLTQHNTADSIGMSRSVYSEIESGERTATAEEIGRIAKIFHVRTDSLIFGEDPTALNAAPSDALELKNVLLNSLHGYLEANLSRNEIIGDVIDITDSGKQVVVDLNGADGKRFSYDAFEQWWADNMLVSSSRQFLEKSNCSWLISCYRTGKKVVDIMCTSKDSDGSTRELKQTYYLSENTDGDIYAICAVSTISDAIHSRQYAEIAAELSESFEGIFYVDISDDSYVALKTKGAFYNIIQNISGKDFFRSSLEHLRGVIHKDDYCHVADFIRKDFLLEKLENGNITSTIFRLEVNGLEIFYRLRISRSEYDNQHVVYALENVSKFVTNEKIQNEQLLRDKTIIEVLASEYSSIYYVNLTENTFETYKVFAADLPSLHYIDNSDLSYIDAYNLCVNQMVYEPDQPAMLKAGSIYNILSVLKDRESFTTVYRSKKGNGETYCEMKIARVGNDPLPTHVVIGFADNSPEKSREIEKAKNINIVRQLAENFEAVYDVDIKTGKYISYSDSEIFSGKRFSNVIMNDDLFLGIAEATDQVVYVDDRPLVRACLTRDYLQDKLSKKPYFQMDIRLIISGIPTWYRLKVVMNEDSNGQGLIVGIFNIEEQRRKDQIHMLEINRLTEEAQIDLLTGIRNKNAYMLFEKELDKTMQESKDPFSVAVFDINDLKAVNDRLGHEEGDRLIKRVSKMICEVFKHSPVFRVGGDEFVAILKGADYEKRLAMINFIRQTASENTRTSDPVIACGISDRNDNDGCLSDVFARADEEMYQNKKYLKSLL